MATQRLCQQRLFPSDSSRTAKDGKDYGYIIELQQKWENYHFVDFCVHILQISFQNYPEILSVSLFVIVKDAFKMSVSDCWLLICGSAFAFNTDLVCILKPHSTIY